MSKNTDYVVINAFRDKTNGQIYDVGQSFSAVVKREKELEKLGYIQLDSNPQKGQVEPSESSET